MKYKGYRAAVSFDEKDEILTGRIAGINDVVGFHAASAPELKTAFHEAVDDYLETCEKIGKRPEKSYSGQIMVRINPKVHANAAIAAELSGKSLNEFTEAALTERAEKVLA